MKTLKACSHGMGSLMKQVHGALSSCFSPSRHQTPSSSSPAAAAAAAEEASSATAATDDTEMATDVDKSVIPVLNSNDRMTKPDATTLHNNEFDHLLVEKGLPRTLHLREQLIERGSGDPLEGEDMANAPLFTKPDTEFIREIHRAFEYEFDQLRSADQITVEKGSVAVIGAYGDNLDQSPSQLLYEGQYYSEVDRTIVGILVMKWILAGEYETFTRCQNKFVRLSETDFKALRDLFIETFKNSRGSYMLIVSMIVNDLGKNSSLRELIKDIEPHRWQIMNHDEVIYYAATSGKIELLEEFGVAEKQRLMKGIRFGRILNMAQLAQAENVPGSMRGIQDVMEGDPDAFPMKFCEVVLDVAGAAGHIDSRGANSWISPVNTAYHNARECVLSVLQGDKSMEDAYNGVLEHRAQLLEEAGWKKLSPLNNSEHRALLRLIMMARAASPKAAQKIEDVVNALSTKSMPNRPLKDFFGRPIENVREALLNGLNVCGLNDGIAIVPYYSPGLIAEAARVTKDASQEVQHQAIGAIFTLMCRSMIGTRPKLGQPGHIVECDISFTLEIVRSPEFAADPAVLDKAEYPTDKSPYSEDIESLMLEIYGIRRLQRRRTGASHHS